MISASQLNTYLFCPRLLFLEAVLGCEGSNVESEEGRFLHDKLASDEIYVESPELALCGKVDVLHEDGTPIEYKRGKPLPDGEPWPGHAIQLCALAMLLESVEGHDIPYGYIWYNMSRERVKVRFDDVLREETCQTIAKAKTLLDQNILPEPLTNRKACLGCNQYRNCLPDELQATQPPQEAQTILTPHIEGQAVYVDRPGSKLSIKNGSLVISAVGSEDPVTIGLARINQVVIQQPAHCTSSFLETCTKQKIPVMLLDFSGRWQGCMQGHVTRNVLSRLQQYQQLTDPEVSLILAKTLIQAKLTNQRVWLRRHLGTDHPSVEALARILKSLDRAENSASLLGMEGEAARHHFQGLSEMINTEGGIEWQGRHKHPSPDPLNSLLSFGYSILMQQAVTACHLAGLDPYLGFYHGLKHGKPSLALDLMEIYRTPVVDTTVLGFLNRGQCTADDFESEGSTCKLKQTARKAFMQSLFERLRTPVKHPVFGYSTTYQRAIHVEARLLSYALLSGLDLWKPFTWR
ncbi:MAG: CRISPR-associated endonuclease Cas1 [Candidatus Melainabacteria bacterium]|nr:CRISPR-associated endonuclease Cas1 [Candidatus Melainabacteria bacterium]